MSSKIPLILSIKMVVRWTLDDTLDLSSALYLGYATVMSHNKDQTAVQGCHCQGDMAERMRKVMPIQRVGVRVCHLLDFVLV